MEIGGKPLMNRKKTLLLVSLVGLAILAAGCVGGPAEEEVEVGPVATLPGGEAAPTFSADVLNIGWQTWYTPTWAGGVIVPARGFDREYLPGVDVRYFSGLQGTVLINNMLAGKTDIAYMGEMPAVVGGTKGEKGAIVKIAQCGWDDMVCMNIQAVKGRGIKTVKDLEGKRISVAKGACSHYFLEAALANNNVKATVLDQSIEVGLANIRAGKVDAWAPWEPGASQLLSQGITEVVTRGKEEGIPHNCDIVAASEFVNAHPDVVVGWLKAEMAAKDWIAKNPDAAAELIQERIGIVPLDVVKLSMKSWILDTVPSKINTEHDITAAKFLLGIKKIARLPDFDANSPTYYFRYEFAEQAAKELAAEGIKGRQGTTPQFKDKGKFWTLTPEYKAPDPNTFPPVYPD
jgi:NitT/TauT family transport system substrate-binding protein